MPASYVDALLLGYNWNGNVPNTPVNVTYSFAASYTGGAVLNGIERDAALRAMAEISQVANVTFTQISNPSTAKLTFSSQELGGNTIGLMVPLGGSGATLTYAEVVMDDDNNANFGYGINRYGYETMLHELGHAMGLDHPQDYGDGAPAPHLSPSEDTQDNTVMSYYPGTYTYYNRSPSSYMSYDIATLQYLYGVNTNYNSGNNTYSYNGALLARTLWDGGGNDTLHANTSTAALLDLREGAGHVSTIGNTAIYIAYGANIENATGGTGNDIIYGNTLANVLYGANGMDVIRGDSGNDMIFGGLSPFDAADSADTLYGGDGLDNMFGAMGNDSIYGDGGADLIHGGQGQDFIYGGDGEDAIYGNLGIDTIFGDNGNDTLFGGGTEVDNATDLLIGMAGDDLIFGNEGDDFLFGKEGVDTLLGGLGNDLMHGDHGAIDIAGDMNDLLFGNEGSDTIYGGGGADIIYGSGNEVDLSTDVLIGNGGADTIFGQDGNDFIYGNSDFDILLGQAGNDVIYGDHGPGDEVSDVSDQLFGGMGADTLYGGGGNDTLVGGDEPFSTGDGNDALYGGGGADVIYAASGSDYLNGGAGNDTLHGGAGTDYFYFGNASGNDMILDFENPGATIGDIIQVLSNINNSGIDTMPELLAAISYSSGNALIDFGSGNILTLLNISAGTLTADDFAFV